jgi:hypothetical protein
VNIKRPTKGKDQKKNKTREKRDHEEAAEEKPLKRRVREYQGEKCITETKRERSPAVSQHVEIHRPTESTEKKRGWVHAMGDEVECADKPHDRE